MIPQISSISTLEKATYNSAEYTDWVNEALEKANIDKSQLVIKEIIDKNGTKTKRWVRPGDAATLDKKGKINSAGSETSNERQASLDSQLNTATQDNGLNRGRPRTGTSQRDSVLNPTGKKTPGQSVPQPGNAAQPQEAAQPQSQAQPQSAYSAANAAAVSQLNVAKQAVAQELEDFKSANGDEMAAREASKFNKFLADTQHIRDARQDDPQLDAMVSAFDKHTLNNGDIADWSDEFFSKLTSNSTVSKSDLLAAIFRHSGKAAPAAFKAINSFECTDEDFDEAASAFEPGFQGTALSPEAIAQSRALENSAIPKYSFNQFKENYNQIGAGSESQVFKLEGKDGKSYVIKATSWSAMGGTPAEFLMNHVFLHNAIFPDSPYWVAGLTRMNGQQAFLLKQPMHSGTRPSAGRLAAYMRAKGFKQVGKTWVDSTGMIRVEDIRPANAVQTPDGQIHVFDPCITMSTTERYKDSNGLSINPKSQIGAMMDRHTSIDSDMLSKGLKSLGGNDASALFNLTAKCSATNDRLAYNGAYEMGKILNSGLVKPQKGKLSETFDLYLESDTNFNIHKLEDGSGFIIADSVPMRNSGLDSFTTPSNSLAAMAVWNQLFPNNPVQFTGIQSGKNYAMLESDGYVDRFGSKLDSKGQMDYALCYSQPKIEGTAPSYAELRSWAKEKGYSETITKSMRAADGSHLLPSLSPSNYVKTPDGSICPRIADIRLDTDGGVSRMLPQSERAMARTAGKESLADMIGGHTQTVSLGGRSIGLSADKSTFTIDGKDSGIKVPSAGSDGFVSADGFAFNMCYNQLIP